MIELRHEHERAFLYADGSVDFEHWLRGVGWTTCRAPSATIRVLAASARLVAFPELEPLEAAELVGSTKTHN